MRRIAGAAVAVASLLVLGACGGGSSKAPATSGPTVTLRALSFSPDTIQVRAGDTVTWKWGERIGHNVTFPSFHSKTVSSGTYTHTFSSSGTFSYRCTIHPTMTGKVIVT